MKLKEFTKKPEWGVCVYKAPYIKDKKIVSPGIIIFNKTFIYRCPYLKNRIDEKVFNKILSLDPELWVKGIFNSGSLIRIKEKGKRWKKYHETSEEDWERFDFSFEMKPGRLKSFTVPLGLASFIDPETFKPKKIKKEFDLCLVDYLDKRYKTQLKLAKTVLLFRKKYKKDLSIRILGKTKPNSKRYRKKLIDFMQKHNIRYSLDFVSPKDYTDEVNRCRINVTLRQHHGGCRAIPETASCNIPQLITDGFGKYASSLYYQNMLNNKNYNMGAAFKHDSIKDICKKIGFMLDKIKKFNPRRYILEEENNKISNKKIEYYFRCLFQSKGLTYKRKNSHIHDITGSSFADFYNSNLKDVEKITRNIREDLR